MMECNAFLNPPTLGGNFSWTINDVVPGEKDKINITTKHDTIGEIYNSNLEIQNLSWQDSGENQISRNLIIPFASVLSHHFTIYKLS